MSGERSTCPELQSTVYTPLRGVPWVPISRSANSESPLERHDFYGGQQLRRQFRAPLKGNSPLNGVLTVHQPEGTLACCQMVPVRLSVRHSMRRVQTYRGYLLEQTQNLSTDFPSLLGFLSKEIGKIVSDFVCQAACSAFMKIAQAHGPPSEDVDSLNVSVAAGIMIHQLVTSGGEVAVGGRAVATASGGDIASLEWAVAAANGAVAGSEAGVVAREVAAAAGGKIAAVEGEVVSGGEVGDGMSGIPEPAGAAVGGAKVPSEGLGEAVGTVGGGPSWPEGKGEAGEGWDEVELTAGSMR